MIALHPHPEQFHRCPYCQVHLEARGWHIPGMRNLADLKCPACELQFYGDLPAGHGLYYPMLLERATGIVHDEHHMDWFAHWLRDSYANPVNSPVGFSVENFRPLRQAVLLNCLDVLYGHCLLKLLNAQYYLDHCSDLDLVVLVPRFLRWMVPEGVAAIWTVDLPLRRGIEWNNWLAAEIRRLIRPLEKCWLSLGFSHPHPDDYNIERFTRVRPFPIDEEGTGWERPKVTYIWREDRIWQDDSLYGRSRSLVRKIEQRLGWVRHLSHEDQRQVVALAQELRDVIPKIDFAIAGLGTPGGLPDWLVDLRTLEMDTHIERVWCERYASSHVVIGVHGSNMLLPSAHAGAVVEMVPAEKWICLVQDILVNGNDARETIYRHRFLPLDTPPAVVVKAIGSLLRYPYATSNFNRRCCDHGEVRRDPWSLARRS